MDLVNVVYGVWCSQGSLTQPKPKLHLQKTIPPLSAGSFWVTWGVTDQ